MGYDLRLKDPKTGETIEGKELRYDLGNMTALDGVRELTFHITYNYYGQFREALGEPGLWQLDGMTGRESEPLLLAAAGKLTDEGWDIDDYWEPTDWNAKRALHALIKLAREAPDGVWEVT